MSTCFQNRFMAKNKSKINTLGSDPRVEKRQNRCVQLSNVPLPNVPILQSGRERKTKEKVRSQGCFIIGAFVSAVEH